MPLKISTSTVRDKGPAGALKVMRV